MSLQRVPINNFRGGLNTRDGVFDLQPNESPDLLDVTITSLVGQLETRKGLERADEEANPVPGATIDHAKQVVLGATGKRFLMLSVNGAIYVMTPSGEVKKIHAGTAASVWDFEVFSDAAFKDWVYMGNGVDAMLKWDGEAAEAVAWAATKGAIPKGGVIRVWENRMFVTYVGAAPQRLYFSEFGDPEATVNEYGFVDIRGSEEDLDAIQDLCPLGARLIVLKRRGVFFISSSVTMVNRHIGGPGVWGRFMTAEMEAKLYFFNPQGIFSTGGVEVSMESGSINNWFPKYLNKEKLENARLIVTKDTYPRLLLAITTTAAKTNDKLIEMVPHINFRRIGGRRYLLLPAFMLHSISATALSTWNPAGREEKIVGTSKVVSAPIVVVTDTLQRGAEAPLSNGGKWKLFAGITTAPLKNAVALNIGESHAHKGAVIDTTHERDMLWTLAEFTNQFVSFECPTLKELQEENVLKYAGLEETILEASPWTDLTFHIYSCFSATEQKGYDLEILLGRSTSEENPNRYKEVVINFKMRYYVVGKRKTIGNTVRVKPATMPEGFALQVAEGELIAWMKVNGKWEKAASWADSTYTKGFAGVGGNWEHTSFPPPPTRTEAIIQNFGVQALAGTGRAYYLFQGETDDGSPIIAHWKSAWIPVQEQEPKERIRRINVELSGDAFIDVFADFKEEPSFSQLLPRAGERKEYGEPEEKAPTEEEPNTGLQYRFTRVRPETHGRFHQIQFRSDSEGKPFKINAAELAVRGGKEH